MPSPLDVEIARRLGTDVEATEEALRAVVDRIRQQVGLYGYARLAGVGTFRQQEGVLTFEADRSLAEAVNHRFAGLESLLVEGPRDDAPPVPTEEPPLSEDPFAPTDADVPDEEVPDEEVPEPAFVAPGPPGDEDAADEDEAAFPPWPELEPEPVPEPTLAFAPPPEPRYEPESPDEPEELAAGLAEDPFWAEHEDRDEPHPLGPYPAPPYEEADFSFEEPETDEEPKVFFNVPPPPVVPEPDEADVTPPVFDAPAEEPTIRWNAEDWDETAPFEPDDTGDAAYVPPEPVPPPPPPPAPVVPPPGPPPLPPRAEPPPGRTPTPPAGGRAATPPPPPPPRPQPRPHRVQHGPNRFAQEQERSYTPYLAGAVVLLLVLAGIVWYLNREPAPGPFVDPGPVAGTDTAATAADTSALAADTTAVDTSTAVAVAPPEPEQEPEPPQQAESTPLRSADPIDPARGGYTVVVASETSRSTAEAVAARFRRQGYRTGVVEGRSGGATRYRVGLGQFPSMRAAEAARDQLRSGGDAPADAWVTRIQ